MIGAALQAGDQDQAVRLVAAADGGDHGGQGAGALGDVFKIGFCVGVGDQARLPAYPARGRAAPLSTLS